MADSDGWHTPEARNQIVEQRCRRRLAVGTVSKLLQENSADCLRERALNLPVDDQRVDDPATIVHDRGVGYGDCAGCRIDLYDNCSSCSRVRGRYVHVALFVWEVAGIAGIVRSNGGQAEIHPWRH